jgi:hypothetical protein
MEFRHLALYSPLVLTTFASYTATPKTAITVVNHRIPYNIRRIRGNKLAEDLFGRTRLSATQIECHVNS